MDTQHPKVFTNAVTHLLQIEGGYNNDAKDTGGETKYGISKRQYPHLNIPALTQAQAVTIYYRDYWRAYQCHQLPPAFANFLFDSVTNHRPKTAIKFIQMALKIVADGIIGPKTIGAIRSTNTNPEHARRILARCFAYRADYYHDLVTENPSQERFLLGWFKRLFLLQQLIIQENSA